MLTADEVRSRTFAISLRGFDRDEVKAFLEEAARTVQVLQELVHQTAGAVPAEGAGEAGQIPAEAADASGTTAPQVAATTAGEPVTQGATPEVASPFAEIAHETQRILEAAQAAADEIRRRAQEEAERETKAARAQAARIIAEGERRREDIERVVGALVDARMELSQDLRGVGRAIERMLRDLAPEPAATTVREALKATAREVPPGTPARAAPSRAGGSAPDRDRTERGREAAGQGRQRATPPHDPAGEPGGGEGAVDDPGDQVAAGTLAADEAARSGTGETATLGAGAASMTGGEAAGGERLAAAPGEAVRGAEDGPGAAGVGPEAEAVGGAEPPAAGAEGGASAAESTDDAESAAAAARGTVSNAAPAGPDAAVMPMNGTVQAAPPAGPGDEGSDEGVPPSGTRGGHVEVVRRRAPEEPGDVPADEAVRTRNGSDPASGAPSVGEGASPSARRTGDLGPLHPRLVRRLKRGLQDLQNTTLDALRRDNDRKDVERFLPDAAAVRSLSALAEEQLRMAHAAGVTAGAEGVGAQVEVDPTGAALAEQLGSELGGVLVTRLAEALRIGFDAGEELPALAERVDAIYTKIKNGPAGDVAAVALVRAYEGGQKDAWAAAGVTHRVWVRGAEPPCVDPRCVDNESAGPVPLEERFPSRHDAPPVRPGCTCSTAPAGA